MLMGKESSQIKMEEECESKESRVKADVIFSSAFDKEEFLKKLIETIDKIPNIKTSLIQENPSIHLQSIMEGKSKLVMGLDFFKMDNRVALNFYKV